MFECKQAPKVVIGCFEILFPFILKVVNDGDTADDEINV